MSHGQDVTAGDEVAHAVLNPRVAVTELDLDRAGELLDGGGGATLGGHGTKA